MRRRSKSLILTFDIGSSSLRTALFTNAGTRLVASTATQQYSLHYTADGGAELDAAALLRAGQKCLQQTLRFRNNSSNLAEPPITAIAGSAFWHSLLGINRHGQPVTPIYTWADSRSRIDAAELRREISERKIQLRTGCMLRASFWPAKLRWLKRTKPLLFRRVETWISPAAWLFRELFGCASTSHSMASGTGLYDLRKRNWDAELCALSGVRVAQLGELRDSSLGAEAIQRELGGAEIYNAIGDGAASNLGSGADVAGSVAINVGTSAAVRTIQVKQARFRLPPGLFQYAVDDERFVVGGAISNAGNLHRWCLRELQLGGEDGAEKALSRVAAAEDALIVLPFWVSERAPTWPEAAGGTIQALAPVTTAADVFRAITTSTFYRLADILDDLTSAFGKAEKVIVSGGILHSPASLAILADSLGCNLHVCRELESSLRGACMHALNQLGHATKPAPSGKLIRHQPALAAKHRRRRKRQSELEARLA